MKQKRSNVIVLMIGILFGMGLMSGDVGKVGAAGGAVQALPATIDIRVDGQRQDIEAFAINGTTFVRLVDVGKAVDFNVYWDSGAAAVQVERNVAYTGKAPAAPGLSADGERIRQEIILKTNALRGKHGQRELTVNARLMEAAQVRAAELAATGTYAHTRPDGRKFTTVTDCPYVGENIHRISTSYLDYHHLDLAQAAMEDWAASQGHLENIINPEICAIGTGVARGKNNKGEEAWYCVQLFLVNGCSVGWVDQPMTGE